MNGQVNVLYKRKIENINGNLRIKVWEKSKITFLFNRVLFLISMYILYRIPSGRRRMVLEITGIILRGTAACWSYRGDQALPGIFSQ